MSCFCNLAGLTAWTKGRRSNFSVGHSVRLTSPRPRRGRRGEKARGRKVNGKEWRPERESNEGGRSGRERNASSGVLKCALEAFRVVS